MTMSWQILQINKEFLEGIRVNESHECSQLFSAIQNFLALTSDLKKTQTTQFYRSLLDQQVGPALDGDCTTGSPH